jgi:hypothetical protein
MIGGETVIAELPAAVAPGPAAVFA